MKLLFDKQSKRLRGFGQIESNKGINNEASESKLDNLIPKSFEGGWKENKRHFKLDDSGEIVFDEDYQPDDTGGS